MPGVLHLQIFFKQGVDLQAIHKAAPELASLSKASEQKSPLVLYTLEQFCAW